MITLIGSKRQRGVALITVLLVFALVTILAQQIVIRNIANSRRTANLIDSNQAYYFALGGESFARQILRRDFVSDSVKVDHLKETWSTGLDPLQIEEGEMVVQIRDLQSLFNVNNLVDERGSISATAVNDFTLLLRHLDLDEKYALRLQDWLDSDNFLTANGGEDLEYAEQPYRIANRHMSDATEMRLLLGMTAEDYYALQPYIVALPTATKYNLNTIDATIAEAFAGAESMASFRSRQLTGGYNDVSQWLGGEGSKLSAMADRSAINSEYFEVRVEVNYSDRVNVLRTQLHRNNDTGDIIVVKRQQGLE